MQVGEHCCPAPWSTVREDYEAACNEQYNEIGHLCECCSPARIKN